MCFHPFWAARGESNYSHRSIQFEMVEPTTVCRQLWGRWIRLFYFSWAGCWAHQLWQGKCALTFGCIIVISIAFAKWIAKSKKKKTEYELNDKRFLFHSLDRLFIRASHVSAKMIQVVINLHTTVGRRSWRHGWIARCPANIRSILTKCKALSIQPKKVFCMRHSRRQSKYLAAHRARGEITMAYRKYFPVFFLNDKQE